MSDMKKLIESIDRISTEGSMTGAAKHKEGAKFGGYWKGTDKNPPKAGMGVGGESADPKFLGEPYIREDEDDGSPIDDILEYLTVAYHQLDRSAAYSQQAKNSFNTFYEMLRKDLMRGDINRFRDDYEYLLSSYPDEMGEFVGEIFSIAGLGQNGTFDDFMTKVGAVAESYGARMMADASHIDEDERERYEKPSNPVKNPGRGEPLFNGNGAETPLTYEDVVAAWKQVFPHSSVGVAKAFGGGFTFKFRLSNGKNEVSNGILDNDPLSYSASLNTDGTFEEYNTHMLVAPKVPNMVYGSEKFRKKTIKNATMAGLVKRFEQVHKFVEMFADNMKNIKFDINEKLGRGIDEDAWHGSDTDSWSSPGSSAWHMGAGIFTEDDDEEYRDSYEDEADELYDGCYVRDQQNDGAHGEIFKMSGDPSDRRVRINDNGGRGWYIHPSRLTKVDDNDPDIEQWFPGEGNDSDESGFDQWSPSVDEAQDKKPSMDHTSDCAYRYGHDCNCEGEMKHASGCHYHYGHDCDCGLDDIKNKKNNRFDFDEGDEMYGEVGADGSMSEAKAPSVISKLKQAKEDGTINADQISKDREGNFVFRQGYYYRNGMDSSKFAGRIDKELTQVGIPHEIVGDGDGDHWAAFKGGAKVAQQSHFWVKVRISNEASAEPMVEAGRRDSEQEAIWQSHYRRAKFNGQDDQQARSYADGMLVSEPKFQTSRPVKEQELGEITEELKTAFEDYVKNNADPEDKKERVTITYNDGHTQTKSVTEKEKKNYETSSSVKSVVPSKDSKGRLDDAITEGIEGASAAEIADAIAYRITRQKPELLSKYGVEFVTDTIDEVASFHEGADELGSSDISAMVNEVVRRLEGRMTEGKEEDRKRLQKEKARRKADQKANRELWDKVNRKGVVAPIDRERYTDLSYQGLEGPFRTKKGGVLYYDPKEGKYYDRDRDMFVDHGLEEGEGDYRPPQLTSRQRSKLAQRSQDEKWERERQESERREKQERREPVKESFGHVPNAEHEIEWLKKKIASLPSNKVKQKRDLERQIRQAEASIAFRPGNDLRTVKESVEGVMPHAINLFHSIHAGNKEEALNFISSLRKKYNDDFALRTYKMAKSFANAHKQHQGKVEEDSPVIDPATGKPIQPTTMTNGQPAQTAQPITTAQTTAQQPPAPKGQPTAVPAPGQPALPAAGQAGGAPVQMPAGTPKPASGSAVNQATTPVQDLATGLQQLSQPGNQVAAKKAADALARVR